jgi:hypothetical protein
MRKPACHTLQLPPAGLHYFLVCGCLQCIAQKTVALSLFITLVRRVGLPVVVNFIISCREGKEHKSNVVFGSRD